LARDTSRRSVSRCSTCFCRIGDPVGIGTRPRGGCLGLEGASIMAPSTSCDWTREEESMDIDEAAQVVAQYELSRWKGLVSRGEQAVKPRVFALADLKQNAVVVTVAGPLELPVSPMNAAPEWCFFADDLPNANWEHPARYIIVFSDRSIQSVPMH